MLVVFSEQSLNETSLNAREIQKITEIARMFGCQIYTIPRNFDDCKTAENALAYVPEFDTLMPALWIGFIPTFERYKAIYDAAIAKNAQLINTPEQHALATELDKFYPLISDLTPKSIMIESSNQLEHHMKELRFPVFVKGVAKSNKDKGWKAVTASNADELESILQETFENSYRTRGKVIIRELVKLKTVATDPKGFPIGREYRAFVYQQEILEMGFYWDDYNDTYSLSKDDKHNIRHLVQETTRRIDVPFMSVDVAQLETDEWIVIEIGDGQFSGLSQISPIKLWKQLSQIRS